MGSFLSYENLKTTQEKLHNIVYLLLLAISVSSLRVLVGVGRGYCYLDNSLQKRSSYQINVCFTISMNIHFVTVLYVSITFYISEPSLENIFEILAI